MEIENEKTKEILISLVIPVKNESGSIATLLLSIKEQTFPPDEIVIVDGGSSDNTVEIMKQLIKDDKRFRIIETSEASPGKGRNIGVSNTKGNWIAFTDAGIKLKKDWLGKLAEKIAENSRLDVIYGNFRPVTNTFFERCAMFAYAPPQISNGIRSKSVASILVKRSVWQAVGGFPDLRAAEDLIFMESIEKQKFETGYAPDAMVFWQLCPDLESNFRKFVLYSKHNVLARRQREWHYGIAKTYLIIILISVFAAIFSWGILLAIPVLFILRTARRIWLHRFEFGYKPLLTPFVFMGVMFLILSIDAATFTGWGQAIITKKAKLS